MTFHFLKSVLGRVIGDYAVLAPVASATGMMRGRMWRRVMHGGGMSSRAPIHACVSAVRLGAGRTTVSGHRRTGMLLLMPHGRGIALPALSRTAFRRWTKPRHIRAPSSRFIDLRSHGA